MLVLLAGCGNLTAGGLSEAEVTVSGDAADPPAGQAQAYQGGLASQEDDEAEGELEAEFRAYLESALGTSEPLTSGPVRVRVDVQGIREEGTGTIAVPAGRYTALRLAFSEIEVEVDAGLVVNGQVITGIVDVDFEADSLTVVKPVRLDLEAGDRVELLVDLNTQDWLFQLDPDLQIVAEELVANAITVRVR
jgi:hypothetical protein